MSDTQAEDTALLIEMDKQVQKRVADCIHDLLSSRDDMATYLMTGFVNHPNTARLIRNRVATEMRRLREEELYTRGTPAGMGNTGMVGMGNTGMVGMGTWTNSTATVTTVGGGGGGAINSGNSLQDAYGQQTNTYNPSTQQAALPVATDTTTQLTKQQDQSWLDRITGKK